MNSIKVCNKRIISYINTVYMNSIKVCNKRIISYINTAAVFLKRVSSDLHTIESYPRSPFW